MYSHERELQNRPGLFNMKVDVAKEVNYYYFPLMEERGRGSTGVLH